MIRWCVVVVLCGVLLRSSLGGAPAKPGEKDEPEFDVIQGRIYAVDETLGLVMLDVGSDRGVKPLQVFTVFRGESLVGYVKIATVQATACGAVIEKERTFHLLKVGDQAITKIARKPE